MDILQIECELIFEPTLWHFSFSFNIFKDRDAACKPRESTNYIL